MEPSNVITLLTGMTGIAGGFIGAKRLASGNTVTVAAEVVDMLQVQVTALKDGDLVKISKIADLESKVAVLESLVTQRAEVEAVKEVVDRIALKVGA
jgi:hypothetical protein